MENYLYRQERFDRTAATLRKLCWLCAAICMITLVGAVMSFAWAFFVVFAMLILIMFTIITLGLLLLREDYRALFTGLNETSPADILIPLYDWLTVAVPVCCALAVVFGSVALAMSIASRERKSPVATIVSVAFALVFVLLSAVLFYAFPYFGMEPGGAV